MQEYQHNLSIPSSAIYDHEEGPRAEGLEEIELDTFNSPESRSSQLNQKRPTRIITAWNTHAAEPTPALCGIDYSRLIPKTKMNFQKSSLEGLTLDNLYKFRVKNKPLCRPSLYWPVEDSLHNSFLYRDTTISDLQENVVENSSQNENKKKKKKKKTGSKKKAHVVSPSESLLDEKTPLVEVNVLGTEQLVEKVDQNGPQLEKKTLTYKDSAVELGTANDSNSRQNTMGYSDEERETSEPSQQNEIPDMQHVEQDQGIRCDEKSTEVIPKIILDLDTSIPEKIESSSGAVREESKIILDLETNTSERMESTSHEEQAWKLNNKKQNLRSNSLNIVITKQNASSLSDTIRQKRGKKPKQDKKERGHSTSGFHVVIQRKTDQRLVSAEIPTADPFSKSHNILNTEQDPENPRSIDIVSDFDNGFPGLPVSVKESMIENRSSLAAQVLDKEISSYCHNVELKNSVQGSLEPEITRVGDHIKGVEENGLQTVQQTTEVIQVDEDSHGSRSRGFGYF